MEFPRSNCKHIDVCVLVGNKASGKTFLASQVNDAAIIESADLLLWCALAGKSDIPDPIDSTWKREVQSSRAEMPFAEVRTRLASFIGKTTPKVVGELQANFLDRVPRPAILVGARYFETVRALHVAGYPIVYVDPAPLEQERRLAALQNTSIDEARTLLHAEKDKCELEYCKRGADLIVRNHYDIRSARVGAMAIMSIVKNQSR